MTSSSQAAKKLVAEDILAYGKEILRLEADAVSQLSELVDQQFEEAVKKLLALNSDGRVVVSGMGKAGFIAQKISATLASVGIPSFFLHPAEAIHGDLGRYTDKDLTIILSNSGETPEVLRMLSQVKRLGCAIIAITGNVDSQLAKHSDVVLNIGKLDEVGPLGLAPTTSTTAMLALGDALAMTVLKCQNFSREKYAFFHPGGSLGRSLMLVNEVMRSGEEHCVVPEDMKTSEVVHKYTATPGRPGCATIVDSNGKLSGVFTDGNLRRCIDEGADFLEKPISEVMTRNPKSVKPEQLVQEAIHVLSEYKIDQVIVADDNQMPVGIIDIQDVIEFRVR